MMDNDKLIEEARALSVGVRHVEPHGTRTLLANLADALEAAVTAAPAFTHTLAWSPSNGCWWVTTQRDGRPWSGMPIEYWLAYGGKDYEPEVTS
jgi:hypothetical protein